MFGLTITFDYLILWSLLYDLLYSISFINEKLTAQQGILCVAYFGPLLSFRFGTCQHHRRKCPAISTHYLPKGRLEL